MAYGEGLAVLNPCSPELVAEKLRARGFASGCVLDVGCGRAATLRHLSGVFPDMRLHGIDLFPQEIQPDERVSVCMGSAEHLPYRDASMDAVLCECTYSLFAEPELCAEEIFRVLRPGGLLLLSDLYVRYGGTERQERGLVRNVYAAAAIEELLSSCGFELLEFEDRTGDLKEMVARMIWDGSLCSCMDEETAAMLRILKPRYGMWNFTK